MKKIIFITLISFLTTNIFAQNKLGHVNAQEILVQMPAFKTAENDLKKFQINLENRLNGLLSELEQLRKSYEADASSLTDLEKQDKELEMQSLYQRIEAFQADAQVQLQKEEQRLLAPIQEDLINAINEVAKEGNYTYILTAEVFLFANESNDVGSLVKKKLGL
ncbi:MAG: OmpH family outer membrane protein [Bacteroidota bacterium]|nr:OmpH family outer membrane protein [Bacteroidota bacterium]